MGPYPTPDPNPNQGQMTWGGRGGTARQALGLWRLDRGACATAGLGLLASREIV